jgi:hypothetical protein
MAHREEHQHVCSFRRVILPLLSAFVFSIVAMTASYRSIYILDEPAEHTLVATVSLEGTRAKDISGELQNENNGRQHLSQESSQVCCLLCVHFCSSTHFIDLQINDTVFFHTIILATCTKA